MRATSSAPRTKPASAISPQLAAQHRAALKASRRVRKLREKAFAEIERLIAFIDACDPYVMDELEEGSDYEPSLGWTVEGAGVLSVGSDIEADYSDDEPSLAAVETSPSIPYTGIGYSGQQVYYGQDGQYRDQSGSQKNWAGGTRDDREVEHDGCEPDCEDEGAQCDDEGVDDREPDCEGAPAFPELINQTVRPIGGGEFDGIGGRL
jgi:hypothetical protein